MAMQGWSDLIDREVHDSPRKSCLDTEGPKETIRKIISHNNISRIDVH